MKKYTLKRLESLGLAMALTATLSSCGEKNEGINKFNLEKVRDGSFYTCFNVAGIMATNELNKLQREIFETIKKEDNKKEITKEEVIEAFDKSEYSQDTKNFIRSFLDTWTLNNDILENFLEAAEGDSNLLGYLLSSGVRPFPFGIDSSYYSEVVYYRDLQFFDNRKGVISSLPATYLQLVKTNEYGDFNVYVAFNFCSGEKTNYSIITDRENKIIAHTNNGYVEIEGKKYQLTNFNWKLKKLGLEKKARKNYSIADLINIQFAMSKIYFGYQSSSYVKTSNVIVFDTTECYISDRINNRYPYYFLEYIGKDIFNDGGYFYRDVLNKNAVAYFNTNNNYFGYIDLTKKVDEFFYEHTGEYCYFEPLIINSDYFAINQIYFKPLDAFLDNTSFSKLAQRDYVSVQSIANACKQVTEEFLTSIIGVQGSELKI